MHDCLVAALGNYTYGAFAVVTVGNGIIWHNDLGGSGFFSHRRNKEPMS